MRIPVETTPIAEAPRSSRAAWANAQMNCSSSAGQDASDYYYRLLTWSYATYFHLHWLPRPWHCHWHCHSHVRWHSSGVNAASVVPEWESAPCCPRMWGKRLATAATVESSRGWCYNRYGRATRVCGRGGGLTGGGVHVTTRAGTRYCEEPAGGGDPEA